MSLSNSQLENVLEGVTAGFFALNSEFVITYWNKAAEIGTRLSRDEVLGKSIFQVFPNAEGADLGDKYKLAMITKTFQSFETSYRDARFEAWYDVRVYPSQDGISVFFQDVSEKKRDQRRKEALAEISTAINNARQLDELCTKVAMLVAQWFEVGNKFVSVYLYDPRAGEVRLVSPSALGYDFPAGVVHQRVIEGATHIIAQAAHTRETVVTDEIRRSTAAELFLDDMIDSDLKTLIVIPLIVQGELQGVLEVASIKEREFIHDDLEILKLISSELSGALSRRRLLDEVRLKNLELESQKQKAVEAGDTLKKFLATFSHELRSPLNSIIGFSELITSQLRDLPAESLHEFMQNIHSSGKHLQQIINDILDLSKIEAGKLDLHVASYPVAFFRESVERVLSAALIEKRIKLEYAFSPEFDEIVVDQTRFKQILINLVSNAIKFSHPEGIVRISSSRIGNDIQFEIRDDGVGIRAEELGHLFKPFRQASHGKGMNHSGIGLGLAITRRLVELHGGNIWIESEWGKGTTVFVRLPIIVDATSERILQAGMLLDALQRENRVKDPGVKPLALVVEDSAQASDLLRIHIESAGYRVAIAHDGEQALDLAKRLNPSVITLDLMLPIKDGWQVLKELKRHPLCRNIPIIIVSIVDEKTLGFTLGAVDYFVKPVNKDDLLKALDKVHLLPRPDSHPQTILVIDDDRAATDLVQVILENEGYRVLKAFHGTDGLELAMREHPDVIILDLIMPELSGFNLAYQLKNIPATKGIPIIVLTSMEVDPETQSQLGEYVSGLMNKGSFTKRDLLREISNIESTF
jgi:PAS domain S-box-containing protein